MTGTELAGTELEEVPKLLSPFQISYFTFHFHISLSHFTFTFHFHISLSKHHSTFHYCWQAFKLFDADGDGLVTTTELRSLIKKVVQMTIS